MKIRCSRLIGLLWIVFLAATSWQSFAAGPRFDPNRAPSLPVIPGLAPPETALECVHMTTATLQAMPSEIPPGGPTTLTWSVSIPSGHCSEMRAEIDVAGRPVGSSGTLTLQPMSTRTYHVGISMTGAGWNSVAHAMVTVKLPPVVEINGNDNEWRALLMQALGEENKTIRLSNAVDMDLTNYTEIRVAKGVTLTSEYGAGFVTAGNALARSAPTSRAVSRVLGIPDTIVRRFWRNAQNLGPRLYTTTRPKPLFLIDSDNVRFLGFRLHGPDYETQEGDDKLEKGIMIQSAVGVEIANMELAGWSGQAIYVADAYRHMSYPQDMSGGIPEDFRHAVKIHDNFIHHNQHGGGNGYGVDVSAGAYALIERNVFDFNRHAISASGKVLPANKEEGLPQDTERAAYVARNNLVLKGGGVHDRWYNTYTHLFDVHGDSNSLECPSDSCWDTGTAGDKFWYVRNSFQFTKDHAIKIRGKPRKAVYLHQNVFVHSKLIGGAVEQKGGSWGIGPNTLGVDTYGKYGVCDFDGDGRDDLFLPTGATWWYSSFGLMHWVYLNEASERIDQLALGDFDGDKRCDVFAVNTSNNQWEISSAGTGKWKPLAGTPQAPLDGLRFGDFDGDGVTDVFQRASDGRWSYVSPVKPDRHFLWGSPLPLDQLRFGDFDGDHKTDVLSLANDQWSVSWGGAKPWERLNSKQSDNIASFVIADVDGNGRDDVVVTKGSPPAFHVSDDGKSGLRRLDLASHVFSYSPLGIPTFWGRFDGTRGADYLVLDGDRMGWLATSGRGTLRRYGYYAR